MNFYLLALLMSFASFQIARSNEEKSSLQSSVVDCVVRTLLADIGNASQMAIYECITSAEEEDDGAEYMAYALPDWLVTKFRSALESQPTTYIRLHGARLSRGSSALDTNSNLRGVPPASTQLTFEESTIIADESTTTVEFSNGPFDSSIYFQRRRRRHLAAPSKTGISKVLMVRVTTDDGTLPAAVDANALSERAFGSVATIKSTYEECSFGKLKMVPASGPTISNGVTDIHVNINLVGANVISMQNSIMNALQAQVGNLEQQFDHIAFCLPWGSTLGLGGSNSWVAFAFVETSLSYFNAENCGHLSKLAHELGHNLGLGHSGKVGESVYADQSSIMGYGYSSATFPVQCFDAAKNWLLGWYVDKSEVVDVGYGAWAGRLYGYVDYDQIATGVVLINVGDVYIQYNRISSINRDTVEKRNQVVIVRSSSIGPNAASSSLAGLDMVTQTYQIPQFDGKAALLIEVCDHVQGALGYFALSIRLSDHPSSCGHSGYVIQPTPSPTNRPSLSTATITAPTASPTGAKIVAGTDAPTKVIFIAPGPTKPPTPWPTQTPTPYPTRPPPIRSPTQPPTPAPVAPTLNPSRVPSPFPTVVPTPLESAYPTVSVTPSGLPTSNLTCDDHPFATFPTDDENGPKRCIWLAARQNYQSQLCVPSHPAYKICEETCGSCTDDCEDTADTFVYNGVQRPCSWLSIRFNVQKMICVEGNDANTVCPETCGSCDR